MAAQLRVIHSADWHLGQTLHGASRAEEHAAFLSWLLNTLEAQGAQLLIIAGDVFDSANPPTSALSQYYEFLRALTARLPALQTVIIGGNHDSARRLDAPAGLLSGLGVHVIGGRQGRPLSELVIPISGGRGWVLAAPFLRPQDLPGLPGELAPHTRLIEGHRALYAALTAEAEALRAGRDLPLIATGHCYMAGGRLSELSERKIQVGNQEALPEEVFPRSLSYVALGHLHRAQPVGDRATLRYAGAPIPLSFPERSYEQQVLQVDFQGARVERIEALPVPTAVPLITVPEEHAPLPEVRAALAALPRRGPGPEWRRPLLEVRVRLDQAEPRLQADVVEALAGAEARLLRIDRLRPNAPSPELVRPQARLDPAEVFEARYAQARGRAPSEALRARFFELLEEVRAAAP